jgi:hypothetical protein
MHLRHLLLLALALRLLLPLASLAMLGHPEAFCTPDSSGYLHLAAALAQEGRYVGSDGPDLFRPPGYPILVSVGTFLGHPYVVTIFLQALLGCLTVYLTYRTACLFFGGQRAATFAGLACACDPLLVVYASLLLSETLFATVLSLAVLWLLRYIASRSVKWLVLSALAVSACAYVRAMAYFLPFWIAFLLAIRGLGNPGWRRAVTDATLFLGVSMALLGVWQMRNGMLTGYFGFSTQVDRALYVKGRSAAERKEPALHEVLNDMTGGVQAGGETSRFSLSQVYARIRWRGLAWMLESPGAFAWIHLKGMLVTLLAPAGGEYRLLLGLAPQGVGLWSIIWEGGVIEAGRRLVSVPPMMFLIIVGMGVMLLPYLVLPAFTLWRMDSAHRTALVVVWAIILYIIVLSGGYNGSARMRLPAMPLLSMLVGYGVSRLTGGTAGRSRPGAPSSP